MAKSRNLGKHAKEKPHSSSWAGAVRRLFTCKYLQVQQHQHQVQQQQQQQKQKQKKVIKKTQEDVEITICSNSQMIKTKKQMKNNNNNNNNNVKEETTNKIICNKKRHHHHHHETAASNRSNTTLSRHHDLNIDVSTSSSSSFTVVLPSSSASPPSGSSFRNMPLPLPFRKLSLSAGCYECRSMVVDPVLGMTTTRDPSSISSCPQCAQIFTKPHNLELHQAVSHAVCELGVEDTSKNIVEIIFQSSWLKKQAPVCKIDRILKVQNTPKTISRFEEYRDTIKAKASRLQPKKQPRCLADGNELLRFHCTTLMCSLGLNGSSNLCNSSPTCSACSIIKNGFKLTSQVSSKGILTTATSGKAHDRCREDEGKIRAMLVCRVIAGRVKKNPDGNLEDDYDSVGGAAGVHSNLDELYVFNPKAILPCFVVIYRGF